MEVHAAKADEAEETRIFISGHVPQWNDKRVTSAFLVAAGAFYQGEAERIGGALIEALPQGVTDRLIAYMCGRKASYFRVSAVDRRNEAALTDMMAAMEQERDELQRQVNAAESNACYANGEMTKMREGIVKVLRHLADQNPNLPAPIQLLESLLHGALGHVPSHGELYPNEVRTSC